MAIETVTRSDGRFNLLIKSRNARWPSAVMDAGAASRVMLCDYTEDVVEALNQVLAAGQRPTVRSGGHCYMDFVANNPNGAILDLSLMSEAIRMPDGKGYRIGAGTQLGTAYSDLYKRHNVTLPGGSCGTVGAGGHITGGGYGVLSRLQGITVDWLTAVDIVTVDSRGKAMARRVDKTHDADLFRAVRGGGGNNFGIITNYYFDTLPKAPAEVMAANISFSWADMTEAKFTKILSTYGNYFETRGKDPDTWGLFTGMGLTHKNIGRFSIGVQFCNQDGTCNDLTALNEFLNLFNPCIPTISPSGPVGGIDERMAQQGGRGGRGGNGFGANGPGPAACGPAMAHKMDWIDATARGTTISGSQRATYKSSYMKKNFAPEEIAVYWKHLSTSKGDADRASCTISVDSYGGLTNRPELTNETAVVARASVMKLQFLSYWNSAADDAAHAQWIGDLYKDLYSTSVCDQKHLGTPYPNDRYEGCYINYPDADMLQYDYWPELYYGNTGLYSFLQQVKKKYDPNNVFHHAMSIRA